MSVTRELHRLADRADRVAEATRRLDDLIRRVDELTARIATGLELWVDRPIREVTSYDGDERRMIEINYLGFGPWQGRSRLLTKTLRVFEHKLADASAAPGPVAPLLEAPMAVRHAAVDGFARLLAGLGTQIEAHAAELERRSEIALGVLAELERAFPRDERESGPQPAGSSGAWPTPPQALASKSAADSGVAEIPGSPSESSHRRKTRGIFD